MSTVHDNAIAATRAAEEDDFWADLMPTAAAAVIEHQRASRPFLGRQMRLGMQADGMLIDELLFELHELGVVGPCQEGQGDEAKRLGERDVLVGPDGLAEVLAEIERIATTPDEDDQDGRGEDQPPPVVETPPARQLAERVSLVKPGASLAVRQPASPPATRRLVRQVVHARLRQAATAPAATRAKAVGRQLPAAPIRLVARSPRGAGRLVRRLVAYLRDDQTVDLLAKHAEAGSEAYTKASEERRARLVERRWRAGVVAAPVVLAGLAWWAPGVLAWLAGVGVFVGVACLAPRRNLEEWLGWLAAAIGAGVLAWWSAPKLATMVPYPPLWAWCTAGGLAVLVCGLAGRKENAPPLIEMPIGESPSQPGKPSADQVIEALCRLGIKDLTPNKLEEVRAETRVIAPGVGRSRRGWHIQLELPWGVTAESVMEKRQQLAAALKRQLGTVWPSQGPWHPAHLVLFLSDLPMATAPQEPWPVAESLRVDIFDPVPMFTDQEGNWVDLQIAYKRILIGGESGSGKSFYVRQIGVVAALDPRTRIVVLDGKANGDMDPLIPIAHGFYVGAQPEEMEEQLAALQAIEREMDRRARFLRTLPREENPENKITSALVDRYPDLAPYVLPVDELQEYTQNADKELAREFTRILTRFSRLGRSAGIILVAATQYPADGVVPVAMRSNFSTKFCLRVEGHSQVEVILGTGSYAAGMKANLFTQAEAGLAWHKGDGQEPAIVRSVRGLDGPACDELVAAARQIRASRGLLTGQAADDVQDAELVIDIAADVMQVMRQRGTQTAHLEELVEWLQDLRPENYGSLDERELGRRIRNAGMTVGPVWRRDRTKQGVDLRKQACGDG